MGMPTKTMRSQQVGLNIQPPGADTRARELETKLYTPEEEKGIYYIVGHEIFPGRFDTSATLL